ncbi:hypothetical protein [Ferruginibacter sp.]
MKRMIFILLLLCMGVGSKAQTQFFKNLKTKAKTAVDNSADRSSSKVVDKTINNTADNVTDSALSKAGKKVRSIFKKKDKKNGANDPEQPKAPQLDSVAIKPPTQN